MKKLIIYFLLVFLSNNFSVLWGQVASIQFKAFQKGDSLYLQFKNKSKNDTLVINTSFQLHEAPSDCFKTGLTGKLLFYTIDEHTKLSPLANPKYDSDCYPITIKGSYAKFYKLAPRHTYKVAIPISKILFKKKEAKNVRAVYKDMFVFNKSDKYTGSHISWAYITFVARIKRLKQL
jgi:hypothetical protein